MKYCIYKRKEKKKTIKDNQTRSRCEQRGGLPSDFGANRVIDGRMNSNFDLEFEEIY